MFNSNLCTNKGEGPLSVTNYSFYIIDKVPWPWVVHRIKFSISKIYTNGISVVFYNCQYSKN